MVVEQNIGKSVGLSAICGFVNVLAILVLAYPEHQKNKYNTEYSAFFEKCLVPCNLLLQATIGILGTMATWYGPVSIVVPVSASATLLANMILFGMLGIEKFTKDVQVGTMIVVSGAIILPAVGPTVQQNQHMVELLDSWHSVIWALVLVIATVGSGAYCVNYMWSKGQQGTNPSSKPKHLFTILLAARVSSAVLSTSLSKLLVSFKGFAFFLVVVAYLACSVVLVATSLLQATEVDQKTFVPASACGMQFINALTGLIIWQDWLVIQSWVSYATVMAQILMGLYLISSMDFVGSSADTSYALSQSVSIQLAKSTIKRRDMLLGSRSRSIMGGMAGGSVSMMLEQLEGEEGEDEEEVSLIMDHSVNGFRGYASVYRNPTM